MKKINLGAGSDIKKDFINHDIKGLKNIDTVHDLNKYPWPWEDNSIDEVLALDVLEHLNDFIKPMEEIYRILKPGGKTKIKVPYWNSSSAFIDPTHKRGFHELTFSFFDPSKTYCKLRPYYTSARFTITSETFILNPFQPYFKIPLISNLRIKNKISKRIIGLIGNTLNNIILDLEVEIQKI